MFSLHSPDARVGRGAPIAPLLKKEFLEILSGRALWTMLLLLCPLVGYGFFQAVSLYGEASAAASRSPALASSLSPLDGVLVPTVGAFYVTVTLLFPFVAIRALGSEKESGAVRLLLQLPYRPATLIAAKLTAILAAWLFSLVPVLSALAVWKLMGGHLGPLETPNLIFGHLLYGLLVGAIALFAASISESAATAAIVTLAFTIGSWVLDFAAAGRPGVLDWLSRLSLTQALRPFERGLLSVGLVIGMTAVILGFCALAAIWLPIGIPIRAKLLRSLVCLLLVGGALSLAANTRRVVDLAEDRRNSFPAADERALQQLADPLVVTVHLAPEDPRYTDLRRNVLAKLERTLPDMTVRLASGQQTIVGSAEDERYGETEYSYGTRRDTSRSTSHREILPLLYSLAGVPVPAPSAGDDYPGYPLVANGEAAVPWFFGGLPLLIAAAWWRSRRPPPRTQFQHIGGRS
jgi:ABC-2 type transport system permease protein